MKVLFLSIIPVTSARQGNRAYSTRILQSLSDMGGKFDCVFQTRENQHELSAQFDIGEFHGTPEPKITLTDRLRFRLTSLVRYLVRWHLCPQIIYFWLCYYRPSSTISAETEAVIDDLLKRNQYDVVVCNYLYFLEAVSRVASNQAKVVVITHDLMHQLPAVSLSQNFLLHKRGCSKSTEIKTLDLADLILSISEIDTELLASMGLGSKAITISWAAAERNTVLPQRSIDGSPARIVFIGSRNPMNVAGIRRFIIEVWPEVRLRTRAELHILGAVGEALQLNDPSIVVYGCVTEEEKLDLLLSCAAVVNPVTDGTGLNIKTIEPLLSNVPVIGYRKAFAGMPILSKSDYTEATSPSDLCEKLCDFLNGNNSFSPLLGEELNRVLLQQVRTLERKLDLD